MRIGAKRVAPESKKGYKRLELANTFEHQVSFQRVIWFAIIGLFAVCLGYLLATRASMTILAILGLSWLILLPYHSQISVYLSLSTFSSALIVPFFPGRPYLWEFAALLAWSGLLVTFSMRRESPDFGELIRKNQWLFIGVIGYSLVLVMIMRYRGVGLRILGGSVMGGRFYFQQLCCAIFPFAFAAWRSDEKTIYRLFVAQRLLTVTYLVSDFVFSVAPKELYFFLQFFELPGDALGFEMQAERFGIRRFQSLCVVGISLSLLALTRYNLRDFFSRRAAYLAPMAVIVIGMGLLSGYRIMIVTLVFTSILCGYAQRFYTFKNNVILCTAISLLLVFTYAFAADLPLAAQRATSFLPGIGVDPQAKEDAYGTLETRRMLRKIGWEMAPQFLWVGRGFGQSAYGGSSMQWDPTGITDHLNMGQFFNGFVGLLVNTGVFGTGFMLLILASGTTVAWNIIRLLRRFGCQDNFSRMSCVIASLWIYDVFAFLFIHGDSEYAMKTFSLQAGLLLVCRLHLKRKFSA